MQIKTADENEVKCLIEWAALEGWNPGNNDTTAYRTADPNGFFVGYHNGQMVASISAIKYKDWGFIGFYIVHPEFRGKGFGYQIWQHAIEYLQGCAMALDGVVEQQHNYRKSGFNFAHNNIRYQWKHQASATNIKAPTNTNVVKKSKIEAYLEPYFPVSRATFNQYWRTQPNAQSAIITVEDAITAYGVIRACRDGYKIGPLFADNPLYADQLIDDLCQQVAGETNIYLDIPEPNTQALRLLTKRDAEKAFETARMYSAATPNIQINKTYGITSFEIG